MNKKRQNFFGGARRDLVEKLTSRSLGGLGSSTTARPLPEIKAEAPEWQKGTPPSSRMKLTKTPGELTPADYFFFSFPIPMVYTVLRLIFNLQPSSKPS